MPTGTLALSVSEMHTDPEAGAHIPECGPHRGRVCLPRDGPWYPSRYSRHDQLHSWLCWQGDVVIAAYC